MRPSVHARKYLLATAAVLALTSVTTADVRVNLPKKLIGEWCATEERNPDFAAVYNRGRPRGVTCGEIGIVAKIAAANSRPMTDQAFMTGFLDAKQEPRPRVFSWRSLSPGNPHGLFCPREMRAPLGKHMGAPEVPHGTSGTNSP
jgi:hypothetical protein